MILYDSGYWNIRFVFSYRGSVFPRAVAWSFPAALISVGCVFALREWNQGTDATSDAQLKNGMTIWSSYNAVLAFLLVFRTQQAYGRFWEGSTLLQEVRGEWFNAVSSLFAFCTPKPERAKEVEDFQHLLVRLMSMLYCTALQQVHKDTDSWTEKIEFEILDLNGVEDKALQFLSHMRTNRGQTVECEILLQWIQRLIVDNMYSGILPIPPPVITRAFQELSRGIVHLHDARKIAEIPFPFPYAQMMTVFLTIHWAATPFFSALLTDSVTFSCTFTFVSVFAYWSINYIASEIEMPFGSDPNDLPMAEMMGDMNGSLLALLQKDAQVPPKFLLGEDARRDFLQAAYAGNEAGYQVVNKSLLRKTRRMSRPAFCASGTRTENTLIGASSEGVKSRAGSTRVQFAASSASKETAAPANPPTPVQAAAPPPPANTSPAEPVPAAQPRQEAKMTTGAAMQSMSLADTNITKVGDRIEQQLSRVVELLGRLIQAMPVTTPPRQSETEEEGTPAVSASGGEEAVPKDPMKHTGSTGKHRQVKGRKVVRRSSPTVAPKTIIQTDAGSRFSLMDDSDPEHDQSAGLLQNAQPSSTRARVSTGESDADAGGSQRGSGQKIKLLPIASSHV